MVSALLRLLIGADFSPAARIERLFYGFAPFSGVARDALIRKVKQRKLVERSFLY
jgi:hypothetical protein